MNVLNINHNNEAHSNKLKNTNKFDKRFPLHVIS